MIVDPIMEANRRLTKILRDLDDLVGSGNTLISRLASRADESGLYDELAGLHRSISSELCLVGNLIDDLPCESSRGRIVPEEASA